MKNMRESITVLQVCMILMLAIGINNHVIIIPMLLRAAGRDAWFSALLASVPGALLMLLVLYIARVSGQQNIGDWLRARIPGFFVNMLLALLCVPLFTMALVTLYDTIHWARVSFLETTPYLAILLPLILVCFYLAYSGIGSIVIVSGILLPLVIALGFLVMTANFPHKDFSLLAPLTEFGWMPINRGIIYATSGIVEIVMILFVQQHLKTKVAYWKLVLLVLIMTELIAGPTYGALAEFGVQEAANLRYPSYAEWRLVSFGFHWSNVDLLAVYQWMSGALIRISFPLFLIVELFGVNKGRKRTLLLASLFVAASVLVLLPVSDMQFVNLVYYFFIPGETYWWCGALIVLTVVTWALRHKGGWSSDAASSS